MVCVCKIDAVMLSKYPLNKLKRLGAIFEAQGEIKVDFNTEDEYWTQVCIEDTANHIYWNTLSAQPDLDEEY